MGLESYASAADIPEEVDLAIVATPATTVPDVVEQCGKKGIRASIILSAGFKEIGPKGKALEDKILKIGQKHDIRIIGPNCLGVMRPSVKARAVSRHAGNRDTGDNARGRDQFVLRSQRIDLRLKIMKEIIYTETSSTEILLVDGLWRNLNPYRTLS